MTIRAASTPLNLLFPQWQGSGRINALYYAARELAERCRQIPFTKVSVPEWESLETERGILGYRSILSQIRAAEKIVNQSNPDFIFNLGGDCGIEPVPVSYLNRKLEGDFTLIWLDAHADLNTPKTSPSACFHGMPLAVLLGLGDPDILSACPSVLRPEQVILAGVRAVDPDESRRIDTLALTRISAGEMASDPRALFRAVQKKGNRPIYVHIDLDVLDPLEYPYIRHPEPGGLTRDGLVRVLDPVRDTGRITGLGLMEFTLEPYGGMNPGGTDTPGLRPEPDPKGLETVIPLLEKYATPV